MTAANITPFPPKVEVEVLNKTHRDYGRSIDTWNKIKILYEAEKELYNSDGFLQQVAKEPPEIYNMRKGQMFYENNLNAALGYYDTALFKHVPKIDLSTADADGAPTGNEASKALLNPFEKFLENCDRKSTKLTDYARMMFLDMALYRTHWTVFDIPRRSQPAVNRLQEQQDGLDIPYLTRFEPHQVLNWREDENGNLQWVVIKSQMTEGEALQEEVVSDVWYILTGTSYAIYTRKVNAQNAPGTWPASQEERLADLTTSGLHVLAHDGIPPVVRWTVASTMWLGNRAYPIAIEHLNQANALSWQMKSSNVCFPIVFSDRETPKAVGRFQFLQLGKDDKFEWSEAKGNAIQHSMKRCEQLVEELYRQCHLQVMGRTANATAQSQSGYAKQQDWQPSQEMLEGYGDVMRQILQRALHMYAAIRQEDVAATVRGYSFSHSSADAAIQRLILTQEANIQSPTLQTELQIEAGLSLIPDADQNTKDKVVEEIRNAPTQIEQAQAEADANQKILEAQLTRMTRENSAEFDKAANSETE